MASGLPKPMDIFISFSYLSGLLPLALTVPSIFLLVISALCLTTTVLLTFIIENLEICIDRFKKSRNNYQ